MKQHASRFLNLVGNAKAHIQEINPERLKSMLDNQEAFSLIDVREDSEWASGHIVTAIHLSKGIIERDIEKQISDPDRKLVVYCSGGFRSALVADSLQSMGYSQVTSLNGGLKGWIEANYPIEP